MKAATSDNTVMPPITAKLIDRYRNGLNASSAEISETTARS
jgi:hypothetical protein